MSTCAIQCWMPTHSLPTAQGRARQAWHQNQFGANFGGPIKKDKLFFFGDYQGYRQTEGYPTNVTVPTTAELTGDFSGITAPIYDPLTTCGYNGNPACVAGQPTRTQFSYNGKPNVIPPSRFSTVAKNLIAFPSTMPAGYVPGTGIYSKPNVANPGSSAEGPLNNYFTSALSGAKNDQFTIRGDQNLSAKDTMFERYTWWKSFNLPTVPYGNGLVTGDPISPEAFVTQQIVVGNTYVFNPTSVADLHLSWLRWNYVQDARIPGHPGGHGVRLAFLHELRHPQQPCKVDCSTLHQHLGADQLYRGRRRIHLLHQQQLRDRFHLPEDHWQAHLQVRRRSSPHGDGLLPEQQPRRSVHVRQCLHLSERLIAGHHRQRACIV